jgi:hypothetical protein
MIEGYVVKMESESEFSPNVWQAEAFMEEYYEREKQIQAAVEALNPQEAADDIDLLFTAWGQPPTPEQAALGERLQAEALAEGYRKTFEGNVYRIETPRGVVSIDYSQPLAEAAVEYGGVFIQKYRVTVEMK